MQVKPYFSIIIRVMISLAIAGGCSRTSPLLTPTGWEKLGEPYDSLTRALEIGMAFDLPDDSVVLLSHWFADRALKGADDPRIIARAHYWLARAARRIGDESTARQEFAKAVAGKPTSETDYMLRRIAWHNGDPDSLSRNDLYRFYREETDYYGQRRDAVMLFSRYMDLFMLMRDIGYEAREMEYLRLSDSCINVIEQWRKIEGPHFNTACRLIDAGDTIGAREICVRLSKEKKVLADPPLRALAMYNLYVVNHDTIALKDSYSILKDEERDPFVLFPIVCAHLAQEALNKGRLKDAQAYIGEMDPHLEELGLSGNLLVALRAKARVMERVGSPSEAAKALREYAETADSIQELQTRQDVIDTETLSEIRKYERMIATDRKAHRKVVIWIIITAFFIAVVGAVMILRRIKVHRRKLRAVEEHLGESERRELAIRIMAEKQGQELEELEAFEDLFSRIRPEFIDRLRQRCPRLGNSSIRVACYIVMGLDTKEIADTMNVRPESVKQTRWRLRKALKVPPEMNLQTFLVSL